MQLAMRRNFGVLAALTAVVLLIGSMPLAAQTCTPNTNTGVTTNNLSGQSKIHGSNWQAQSFTVAGSGCFTLNQVTVSVRKTPQNGTDPANLVVAIYNVAFNSTLGYEVPTTAIASMTLPASTIPAGVFTDVTVTFAAPPQLAGGAQYALVVYQDSPGGSGQRFYELFRQSGGPSGDGSPYGGGRWFKSGDAGSTWDSPFGPGGGIDIKMSICVSPCVSGCTLTQGFWKNHGGRGPQPNAWPVSSLTLGTHSYTQSELLDILEQSVNGNGLVSLAHQLIAAKLNIANGASAPSGVLAAIASADAMIGSLIVPPVGSGFLDPSVTSALTTTLDMYNNGVFAGGPPHCE